MNDILVLAIGIFVLFALNVWNLITIHRLGRKVSEKAETVALEFAKLKISKLQNEIMGVMRFAETAIYGDTPPHGTRVEGLKQEFDRLKMNWETAMFEAEGTRLEIQRLSAGSLAHAKMIGQLAGQESVNELREQFLALCSHLKLRPNRNQNPQKYFMVKMK